MWSTFSFNKINLYFLYGLLDFLFVQLLHGQVDFLCGQVDFFYGQLRRHFTPDLQSSVCTLPPVCSLKSAVCILH